MPAFDAQIRIADPSERARVLAVYAASGYHREVDPLDTIWLAESAEEAVGIVRVAATNGIPVLRGMRIASHARRQGLGTRMLLAIAQWLGDRECYCLPYPHLVEFYGQIGFVEINPATAPAFLAERIADYLRGGEDVILMWRPPHYLAGASPSVSSI